MVRIDRESANQLFRTLDDWNEILKDTSLVNQDFSTPFDTLEPEP